MYKMRESLQAEILDMENRFLKSVYQKLAAYCAYQERCTQEVRQRMTQYELSAEEAEQLLEQLRTDRFLSERRFAESFSRGKFRSNRWGRNKIRYALRQKGINDQDIRHGLAEIPEAEYRASLYKLLEKKQMRLKPSLTHIEKQQRLFQYARQKGYETDLVRTCVQELAEE